MVMMYFDGVRASLNLATRLLKFVTDNVDFDQMQLAEALLVDISENSFVHPNLNKFYSLLKFPQLQLGESFDI